MRISKELYMKFPVILREKLLKGELEFPEGTLFEYADVLAYRAVSRAKGDKTQVNREDFRSYFEEKKTPKKVRGTDELCADSHYYGVSLFTNRKIIERQMKFPNPRKKLAQGYVSQSYGPQETKNFHVCWWLYEGAEIKSFKVQEEEEQ